MSPIKNQKDYCEESAPNAMLSPDRRTRSYDCNLDQIKMGAEPLTPSKKGRGIFGSLEKGIDQVRLLLTPNKKKNKDSGNIFSSYCVYQLLKIKSQEK